MATVEELIIKLSADNRDLKNKLAESEKSVSSFGGSVGKLGPLVAGAFSVAAVVAFGKASFAAFEEQDKANRRLLFALKGNQSAFKTLTDQAGEFQSLTGVADDQIQQIQMLAAQSGKTTSEIKKITEATINLAAATGQDLQSAYMMLNNTFTGSAGRLGRLDKDFTTLTKSQLQNGAAIDLVLTKYKGLAAESATETEKLAANWDEVKESAGGAIAKVINPLLEQMNVRLRAATNSSFTLGQRLSAFGDTQYARFLNEAAAAAKAHEEATYKQAAATWVASDAGKEAVKIRTQQILEERGFGKAVKNTTDNIKEQKSALDLYIESMNELYKKQQEWANFDVPNATAGMFNAGLTPVKSKGITTQGGNENLIIKQTGAYEKMTVALKNAADAQLKYNNAQDASTAASQAFMAVADAEINSIDDVGKAIWNTARQIIASKLAEGIASAVASALESVPFPANIIAAGIAGGAAGALFNKLVPKLASGGIAYGTTNAIVGEYPGARTNPEIIAPLDKLQTMLGGSQRVEVYGILKAGDIYLSNKRGSYLKDRRG